MIEILKKCLNKRKAVEQNYLTKIANVYIVFDLDAWLKNPTINFKFKDSLFRATNIIKKVSNKKKYVCKRSFNI